ncbi:hypothetical protein M0R45_002253 [Rubus argutus]|uniref:Uncharacterized protein n=1 Tax=Rubus argutus TaxID=59490 RepID=A0AAW1VIK0_RUBAR
MAVPKSPTKSSHTKAITTQPNSSLHRAFVLIPTQSTKIPRVPSFNQITYSAREPSHHQTHNLSLALPLINHHLQTAIQANPWFVTNLSRPSILSTVPANQNPYPIHSSAKILRVHQTTNSSPLPQSPPFHFHHQTVTTCNKITNPCSAGNHYNLPRPTQNSTGVHSPKSCRRRLPVLSLPPRDGKRSGERRKDEHGPERGEEKK